MSKGLPLVLLLALTAPALAAKTPLDLLLEGRFAEVKAILDTSNTSPRYQILYFAMIEGDAARACSLYQVIAIRYPGTDCDSVARIRLDQAQEMGLVLMPIAEWSQAPQSVRPLALRRPALPSPPVMAARVEPPAVAPVPVVEPVAIAAPEPEPVAPPVTEKVMEAPVAEEKVPAIPLPALPRGKEPIRIALSESDFANPDTVAPVVEPKVEPVAPPPVVSVAAEAVPEPIHEEPPAAVSSPSPPAQPVAAEVPPMVTPPPATAMSQHAEQPEPAAATTHDRSVSNGSWYIQVGAFANYDNAHRLALALQNAGFRVKLVPRDTSKGRLLQVRVGGYATRAELPDVAEQLKEKFDVPTVFVSE